MNFDFTEEQQIITDSVARFVQENYDLEARRTLAGSKQGFSNDHWQTMAELGWLGLPLAEADGGFGGSQIDTMLVMEQFGKGLVLEPFFASVILGAGALKRSDNATLRASCLPSVVDGSHQLALAYAEEQSRFDLHDVVTTAKPSDSGFILNGQKSMVIHGATANSLVVSARESGGQTDTQGISLLLVDATADGVKVSGFPTVDGLQAAEVSFTDVAVPAENVIAGPQSGHQILSEVAQDAMLALCAEAVGAMEVLYKDTVAYTSEREQFGHALAQFQVLQHRMVEMFMEYEQCKSLLYRATMETAQGLPTAARTTHALKYLVGKNAVFIGENAVQLHGGMGMTEELRIGHYFKRLLVIDAMFGDSDHHLQQFAA